MCGLIVVCPDLRVYGRSTGRFALAGHDRGGAVALRLVLGHPDVVTRVALIDCLPTTEHLSRITTEFATQWWHWFFSAQPDIPERVINADPDSCTE